MFGNSFTTLFFKGINFAVLIGVAYWLFLKYVKNKIEEKVNQKDTLLKGLEEQGYFLEGKMHDLENQLVQRETKITHLKQKIDEWVMRIQAEKYKKEEEHTRNITEAVNRVHIKNDTIIQKKLHEQVLLPAIEQTRQILIQRLNNNDAAKTYLTAIIKNLERK